MHHIQVWVRNETENYSEKQRENIRVKKKKIMLIRTDGVLEQETKPCS